jgi:hypothetical protein
MNFKSSSAEFRRETAKGRKEFPRRPSAKISATLRAMDFKEGARKEQRDRAV